MSGPHFPSSYRATATHWHRQVRIITLIEAALKHNDCFCRIKFVSAWYLKRVFAALEEPFPAIDRSGAMANG